MKSSYGTWPVYGQHKQVNILQQALERGTLSHAYLLYGLRGLGKKYITQWLLKQLLCERGTIRCSECESCRRLPNRSHPDVMFLPQPQASNIGVDDIRTVVQFVSRSSERPQSYKAVVIERAEYLTTEASNALLKVLEEAPKNVLFVLLAQHVSAIMPTVRSRCTLLKLLPLTDDEMRAWISQYKLAPEDEDIIISVAMGRPGRALDLIADNALGYRTHIDAGLQLLRRSTADNFAWFKQWQEIVSRESKEGGSLSLPEQSLEEINYIELVLRDLILGTINPGFILNTFLTRSLTQTSSRPSLRQLLKMMAALRQLRYNIQQNVNVALAWEYFILQINQLKQIA